MTTLTGRVASIRFDERHALPIIEPTDEAFERITGKQKRIRELSITRKEAGHIIVRASCISKKPFTRSIPTKSAFS